MRQSAYLATILLTASLLAACSKPDPDEHLQKGDEFVAQGMLREASIEYRNGLQADPNRGDIRMKLADAYMRLEEPAQALGEYVRAADLLPDNAEAQLEAGRLLLLAGQFEDAKTRVGKALDLEPDNVEAQILLGNTLAGLKDMDGALAEYQQALALDQNADQAYRNIATIQFARGDHAAAESAFRKALEVAPSSVPVHMALANFLWATGRVPEAEQTLKDALELDPANLVANRALGTFYLGSGRAAEAEPFFRTIANTAKTTEATIALADYYLVTQRYDQARQVLGGLVPDEEAYAAATLRLAAIDVALGIRAQAQDKLHEILQRHPKDMAARLFSARLLVMDGKRDEALAVAQSIVKDEPHSQMAAGAYQIVGAMHVALDRPEDAIKAFEEVIRRQPDAATAKLALARLRLMRGETEGAETLVRDVLTAAPDNPVARAELVRILLARNEVGRARTELATLQKDFPNAVPVLNLQAAQQLADRQVAAARATYVKAAGLAPNDLEALAGIVRIDLAAGRASDALDRIELGLKAIPPSGRLYTLAAQAYAATGDGLRTEELLKKAIEVEPTRLEAYSLLGVLYARQNRLGEAEAQFRETVARNPSSTSAGTMLGMLYDAQRRTAEAEAEYRRVLGLDPDAAVAANNLAWIYVASGRTSPEALRLARAAHRRLPDEPNVNDTLGWIYVQQGEFGDAIPHLEASVAAGTTDPMIHYHLGKAYAAFGESEKARAALERALAADSPFDGIDDARRVLAELP